MVFTWDADAPSSLKVVFVVGFTAGTATLLVSCWCIITILSSKKLRKPLWLFRASLCLKDILLCIIVLLPNFSSSQVEIYKEHNHAQPYLSAALIASISSSFFTILCASIDRYHASTRPFRYHIGDMMPTSVAVILIFNSWMISVIISVCVVSDYSKSTRESYGILLEFVSLEIWQKAILITGLTFVFFVSTYLLGLSLAHMIRQKQESRLRIESGEEEPIRSRRNSAIEEAYCDKPSTSGYRTDSESEANQFFLRVEDPVQKPKTAKRKWSLKNTQNKAYFTPTTYRPSILRRIRDTWYLYVVIITWGVLFLTTLIPFYFLLVGAEYCNIDWKAFANPHSSNSSVSTTADAVQPSLSFDFNNHCILGGISECLLLSHGFICVITYTFADDVFRPKFLQPIAFLVLPCVSAIRRNRRRGSVYGQDRRRTLSRNSNIANFGV
ncbi:uncharacterized protein LOC120328121 [Styela clava]